MLAWLHVVAYAACVALVVLIGAYFLTKTRRWSKFAEICGPWAMLVFVGLAAVTVLLVIASAAYAQTGADVSKAVCSTDGMQVMEYVAGAIIASGAYSCLKKAVAKLPKPIQNALNFVLGDWHQILVGLGVLKA